MLRAVGDMYSLLRISAGKQYCTGIPDGGLKGG